MLSELEQYLQRNLNEAQEQRFLAEEKIKRMEYTLFVIAHAAYDWDRDKLVKIAREALKDD